MSRATPNQVIEAFGREGFDFAGKADNGWFRVSGRLFSGAKPDGVPCEIELDPNFFELPRVRLLEIPTHLPGAVPHLNAKGMLCYIASGTVTLDIFDPVGQSLACLRQAQLVFDRIMRGEMVEDLAEEFYAYWNGAYCLSDLDGNAQGRKECFVVDGNERPIWFVTNNLARTKKKAELLGFNPTDRTTPTYSIKTTAQPRPVPGAWPPKTVSELLSWQGQLDRRCRRSIHRRVQQGERDRLNALLILIDSPKMTYAFGVIYERDARIPKVKLADRRDRTLGLSVLPFAVFRIDERYIAERNIPSRNTLAGKAIALIGCGTIGGFLAEMLVKAGAGTQGGTLKLIDFDTLVPQNLGRHRLGFPSLLQKKAVAMADELERLAPGVSIEAITLDARDVDLSDQHLLLDATGEEALGHWLADYYPRPTQMLSVWIEGPGVAVRSLLRTAQGGCYRCLWHFTRRGEMCSTSEPLPNVLAGHGCEGLYVPFSASASVQAASLGLDAALDWVNDIASPALRTRILDSTFTQATPDGELPIEPGCPACQ